MRLKHKKQDTAGQWHVPLPPSPDTQEGEEGGDFIKRED